MTVSSRYNPRILSFAHQQDFVAEIATIETYPEGIEHMARKGSPRLLRISDVDAHCAMLLKQFMLALDGEALISPAVYLGDHAAKTDVLLFASLRQLQELITRLHVMPMPALQTLAAELEATISAYELPSRSPLSIAGRVFDWGRRTYVIASYDITADSGVVPVNGDREPLDSDEESPLLAWACLADSDGADMLDLGFADAHMASFEERALLVSAIKKLSGELSLPIAVRCWRAETVAAALDAGAHLVHDRWGLLTPDGEPNNALVELVAQRGVPLVLTCEPAVSNSAAAQTDAAASQLLNDILRSLRSRIAYAQEKGIRTEQLLIDSSISAEQTDAYNRILLRRLGELRSLGLPLMVDMIGDSSTEPDEAESDEEERMFFANDALPVLAIWNGADIVKVYDTDMDIRLIRKADQLIR